MCGVVLLMLPKLSRGIGNHFASLHQHATESLSRGVTVHHEVLARIEKNQDQCSGEASLELLKAGFHLSDHTYGVLLFNRSVMGFTILEKF
jgi:hypothetical protein